MKILSLTVLAILFTGCTIHEGATYGEKVIKPNGSDIFKLNSVAILDKELQKWEYLTDETEHNTKSKLSVEKYGIYTLDTGNVEVFATFRNRTDYNQQLSIRTQFYDINEITIEKPTAWKRLFLPKNGVMTYKEKSTQTNVKNFLIEVKEGN